VQQRALQAVSLQHGGADALDERTVGTGILSALQIMTEPAHPLPIVRVVPTRVSFGPMPPMARFRGSAGQLNCSGTESKRAKQRPNALAA
jgi:hypothetical protein